MKEIKCILVSNHPNTVKVLKGLIQKFSSLDLLRIFSDPFQALDYLKANRTDLVFLDTDLPDRTELANVIAEETKLVLRTTTSQVDSERYEREKIDYLIKPITLLNFSQAVRKIELFFRDSGGGKEEIFLKSGKVITRKEYRDILFFEGKKEYIQVVTTHEDILIYNRMKELEKKLPISFIRIHHSFIVNTRHIQKIENNHVLLGQRRLSISDKYRNAFFQALNIV